MQAQWNKIKKSVIRILDANVNRACEGLRVLEDLFRLVLNDEKHSQQSKKIRHEIRELFESEKLIISRDSEHDVGKAVIKYGAAERSDLLSIARANAKRAEEAMRVIEESMKLPEFTANAEDLKVREEARYQVYTLEKELLLALESYSSK